MKKNGFTLIELLVIIALIGVISTIGVISYTKISKAQKDKLKDANIALIETAAVKYGEANKEQVKEGNKALIIENKELTEKDTKNSLTITVEVLKYLGYLDEKSEGIEEIKDSEKVLLYIDNNKVKARYAGSAFNFSIKQTNKERQESEATIGITVNPAEDEEGDYTYKCEIQGNSSAIVKGTEKTLEEMGVQTIDKSKLGVSFTIENLGRGVNLVTGKTPNSYILTCSVTNSVTNEEGITLTKTTKIYTTKETELTAPEVEVKKGEEDYKEEWSKEPVCIKLKEEGSGTSYTYSLYYNGKKTDTNKTLDGNECFTEDGIYEIEIGNKKNGFSSNDKGYAIIKIDKTPPEVPTITMNKWRSNNQNPKPNDTNAQIAGFLGEVYTEGKWSNRSIYAEANSTDATSGIDYYLYTATGNTEHATDVKKKYRNVEAEGTSSVQFKACDKAGNCSDYSDFQSMKIDKTAPNLKLDVKINYNNQGYTTYANQNTKKEVTIGGWFGNNYYGKETNGVNMKLSYTDALSGINYRKWSYNNTTNAKYKGNSEVANRLETSGEVALSYPKADGKYEGTYIVRDQAGNENSVTVKANVDFTAPTCTSSGGNSDWTNGTRTITGTCKDALSGCYKGIVTKKYSNEINTTTAGPGDVKDNAGNVVTCPNNQTVKIDKSKPKLTCSKKECGTSGCKYELKCEDTGGSGCVKFDNDKTTKTKTYKEDKTITKKDKAGNSGSCKVNVTKTTCNTTYDCSYNATWVNGTTTTSKKCSCSNGRVMSNNMCCPAGYAYYSNVRQCRRSPDGCTDGCAAAVEPTCKNETTTTPGYYYCPNGGTQSGSRCNKTCSGTTTCYR